MKFTIMLGAFLFLMNHAHSAEEAVIVQPHPKKVVVEDSSEFNRMDKQYTLAAQIFGYGPNPALATGFAGGVFLDRNSLIQLEVMSNETSYSGLWSKYELRTSSLSVYYKRFTSNSFYFKTGLDHRRLSYDYQDDFLSTTSDIHFDGTSTAVSFSIGNQWQWSGFTMGCDWVGYVVPFTSSTSNESIKEVNISSDANKRQLEGDKKRFVEMAQIQLLHFYLGASF